MFCFEERHKAEKKIKCMVRSLLHHVTFHHKLTKSYYFDEERRLHCITSHVKSNCLQPSQHLQKRFWLDICTHFMQSTKNLQIIATGASLRFIRNQQRNDIQNTSGCTPSGNDKCEKANFEFQKQLTHQMVTTT